MTDVMHEQDFPHLSGPLAESMRAKHRQPIPAPWARQADVQNDARCTVKNCDGRGLCPRHNPAVWAEHMAKHVRGESL